MKDKGDEVEVWKWRLAKAKRHIKTLELELERLQFQIENERVTFEIHRKAHIKASLAWAMSEERAR